MPNKVTAAMSLSSTDTRTTNPGLSEYGLADVNTPYHYPTTMPFSFELQDAQDQQHTTKSVAMLFLILGLSSIITALSFQLWLQDPSITAENALLELGQGAFLFLASIVQGLRAWRIGQSHVLNRDLRIGLSLFTFTLLLREVDIGKLGSAYWWHIAENTLRTLAAIAILSFGIYMLRRAKWLMQHVRKYLFSPMIVLTFFACLIYLCGWPFDKELFSINKHLSVWIEETLELNACLLLLIAGFASGVKSNEVRIQAPASL